VSLGLKWFKYIANDKEQHINDIDYFHHLSKQYFKGKLKEPFNHIARYQAGLTKEWYLPLSK